MPLSALQTFIKNADDLVTSREQTRAGFVEFALKKKLYVKGHH